MFAQIAVWPQPAARNWWYTCERCSKLCQALSSIIMPGLQLREHRLLCTGDDIMLMTFPLHTIHCISMIQWSIACHRCSCTAGILQVPGYCSFQSGLRTSLHIVTIQGEADMKWGSDFKRKMTVVWFMIFSGKCGMIQQVETTINYSFFKMKNEK